MTPWLTILIASLAVTLSSGGIIFAMGRNAGRVETRLDEIERRLMEIEHALRRNGIALRGSDFKQ